MFEICELNPFDLENKTAEHHDGNTKLFIFTNKPFSLFYFSVNS